MSTVIRAGLLTAVALLLPAGAAAEAVRVPCERPFVFPGAALNVVVMPYSQPASLPGASSKVGEQLGALVELEAVLELLKFQSIGFIQIVGRPTDTCAPEIVLDKLLGRVPGATRQVENGKAVLMIWGRIFESGSDLYVQSYVRFQRRGADESIRVTAADRPLDGRLSGQSFACAPRKIARADLEAIQKEYAASSLLRQAPDPASPFVRIPEEGGPYSFWITATQGDWVQLEPMTATEQRLPRGWVRARSNQPRVALDRFMPEMSLVEGIAGYLVSRVGGDATQTLESADNALGQYLSRWSERSVGGQSIAPANAAAPGIAIPEQLRGFIALLQARPSDVPRALARARSSFDRAASLLPYSAEARNLAAMTRVALAFNSSVPGIQPTDLIDPFVAAVSTDPANPEVLKNLSAVYDLVLEERPTRSPGSEWTMDEAERKAYETQRQALRAFLSARR